MNATLIHDIQYDLFNNYIAEATVNAKTQSMRIIKREFQT